MELKVKLGVGHDPSTIRRYMVTWKGGGLPTSTWSTFLANHASELWTMDLTTQPMWNHSVRYVLVLMELQSRRVVHVAVTASPTLAWVKQRIREATPFGSVPRFLLHDNDGIFGQFGRRRPGKSGRPYRCALDLWLGEVMQIKGVPIPYGAPNAAAHIAYYNQGRPHQGIEGIPEFGPGLPRATPRDTGEGPITTVAHPVLGGLHYDYRRAA